MKKKRILLIGGIVLILIIAIILILVIKKDNDNNKEDNNTKSNRHEMLVSINPSVKLTFDIDEECKESPEICLISSSKVVEVELVNEDAKNIYKDLELKDKTIYESILLLCDTAKENNIEVNDVKIVSSYLVNDYDLNMYIKNNSTQKVEPTIKYIENELSRGDLNNVDSYTTTKTTVAGDDNTTTVRRTKKITEDPHKDTINLNDKVKVTEVNPCGTYIKINNLCMNNTIAKLKERFPSVKQQIIDLAKKAGASDSDDASKLYKKYPLTFKETITSCAQAPTGGICNNKRYGGAYTSCNQYGLQLHYLTTSDNTYKKYFEHSKLESDMVEQNIYYEARCEGETPNNSAVLTEELCEKYNLKCDRW
jgi:hypothetical protein